MNLNYFVYAVIFIPIYCECQVLELTDSFLENGLEQPWLVMFYAPWCGYCKHLTPVYETVAKTLRSSGIHVGKIDATRFNAAARKYDIRGFPTIKFIRGSEVTDFNGERTADAIAKFGVRANSPAVRTLQGSLPANLGDDAVLFVYVGTEAHHLHATYTRLAFKYRLDAFFFYSSDFPTEFPEDKKTENLPSVFVVKQPKIIKRFHDGGASSSSTSALETSLGAWLDEERWPRLVDVTPMALRQLADVERIAVIAVIEKPKANEKPHVANKLLKDVLRTITEDSAAKEGNELGKVQLGFTHDLALISSITVGYVTPPAVIAIDAKTSKYSLAPLDESTLSSKDAVKKEEVVDILNVFVNDVIEGRAEFYGGQGWWMSIRRLIHEIFSTIVTIWMESPLLGCLVFGLPSLVISFICYTLCCMETIEDTEAEIYEDEEWDSEDETMGGLESGDGGHLERTWQQRHLGGGSGSNGEVTDDGGGDATTGLRRRGVTFDENTTWDEVLQHNVPSKS